ncbi:MAG: phage virion morphogenesis protein [Sulfuricurvum sp.]|jgi:phage virion morphogenesis protein|uniref:phage virion morphogenesis protein n=1 Tax=Sulfuricurvum sp. TaxID=2025608 RepID=UPI0025F087A8|nr:phage virion morphogenesis protein [Sulfuricurvum sp.]MCK9372591.1 phage virion morphogenesis protein [Sulfuricurvum sp.]
MSIEVTGIEEIQTKLSRLAAVTETMRPIMAEIGNKIINEIDDTFDAEGKPKWVQLSRTTLRLGYTNMGKSTSKKTHLKNGKVSRGFERYIADRKILQKSGRLRSSIVSDVSDNEVVVGTNLKYAAIHQFGGMAGRGKKVRIPARPFMPIDANGNLEPGLRAAILSYVDGKLEEAVK